MCPWWPKGCRWPDRGHWRPVLARAAFGVRSAVTIMFDWFHVQNYVRTWRPNAVFILGFREPGCSGCRPIVISHFNTTVSTFRDCFRRFGLRARVCPVGLPDCPAVVQNTLSSVKLCLSLSKIGCFHAASSETVLVSFRFLWPCIVSKVWRERKPKRCIN